MIGTGSVGLRSAALLAGAMLLISPNVAHATDEIQVYNGEIADPGQWTLQQHLNYAIQGRKAPDFVNGLIPNHALNGTPELAYGVNDWNEIGFYVPFAVDKDGHFLSNGFKIRELFVSPHADKRDFFYGVNFEFSYLTPKFSETRFGSEIRPIIGFRRGEYELILNPIVDIGFGTNGEIEFAPAARVARKFGDDLAFGVEYYTDLGPFRRFLPLSEQQHTIYGVIDFKIGRFDIDFGLGYGLTAGSDKFIAKLILGTDLNRPEPPKK